MTKDEMLAACKRVGALKDYFPVHHPEHAGFELRTRRPPVVKDGVLKGSEVWFDGSDFQVWSHRKKLCKALAGTHRLRVRLRDGEAELWVPGNLADRLLPMFGVKVKQNRPPLSEDQLKALKERFEKVRQARSLKKTLDSQGTSGDQKPPEAAG